MPISQQGQINTTALIVPDLYVQIVPPQNVLINGVPTNVAGAVGTATWGPVGAPTIVGSMADYARIFGAIQPRKYDMGTLVAAAVLQGANNFRCVRVTDGSDAAASATLSSSGTGLIVASKYTGSLGNSCTFQISAGTIGAGSGASSYKVSISMPGQVSEVFDNILSGLSSVTVTAGTGYTAVPTATVSAPNGPGSASVSVQAAVSPALVVVGTPTVGAGGSGYAANDFITLPNGVVVKVATVSSGAVATLAAISTGGCNAGQLLAGSTPANPVAQVSTTGVGVGATINLVWGLGAPIITNPGSNYITAGTTITLSGGGAGSGGSYAAVCTPWLNMANAINNGQSGIRGPSNFVVATSGAATGVPALATTSLTGGLDGASAIAASTLVGVDTVPRKGMYALRNTGSSVVALADADDSTQWSTQVAYGLSEGAYMILTGPVGDTITNAIAAKASAGIDSYAGKMMFGDWVYFNDTVNGQVRLISPQGFVLGELANLSPQNSTLNKPLFGIVGTQKSFLNQTYSSADLQALIGAGIDVIANPAPAGNIFSVRAGHNTSSNAVTNGDNYTRMTNFIAATINAGMGIYVGQLQSSSKQRQAKATLDNFFAGLAQQGMIGTSDGSTPWQVILDKTNNPQNRVALGYMQADVKVIYLSVIEKFLINVEGGQSVQISRTSTTPQ